MKSYDKMTLKMAFQLTAPQSWVASIGPALFGILYCTLNNYYLTFLQKIFLIISCIFMQSSVNTLNDYVDFIKGNDTEEDNVEKSDAILVYNNINPKSVLKLGIIYLLLGCLLGTIACIKSGFAPFAIGIIGVLTVCLYSGETFAVSALPIGELISGFVMGSLIPFGIISASDGKFHFEIIFYSIPFLIGIALIMMSNNGCDIEKDLKGKRYTLAVILGRKKIKKIYKVFIAIWIISLVYLSFIQFGNFGYLIFLFLSLGRKVFLFLFKSELLPQKRIEQMKMIVIANIIGNGAYLLTMFAKILQGEFI